MKLPDLSPEIRYQFARSGGAGGQNVNKVATKAELRFDLRNSTLLTAEQKVVLEQKLASKLTTDGELVLTHQTERTQLANREKVTAKFYKLLQKAFETPKARRATKPSKAAVAERIADKKRKGDVKANRRRIDPD
ncbi:alternative ribosome rescue aminoacyl-tRNA hydrolase ArfB [Spirosoma rhododendri]|uniref:Aminoacyl-tRNA hydrolase n=1 Tax=Spirosoma rhododendri TaxID=2728024 RepID=A0A7L5DN44_9BACT|nr:alternative ribosome rescue aminoacyl-tRNA hydrolase ArfB [Spirosoma rhododendri]QJD78633.1 aminoacyl-tRNA hydrolase [Spirosoma rhododendri]